jgi:hypothetical protein
MEQEPPSTLRRLAKQVSHRLNEAHCAIGHLLFCSMISGPPCVKAAGVAGAIKNPIGAYKRFRKRLAHQYEEFEASFEDYGPPFTDVSRAACLGRRPMHVWLMLSDPDPKDYGGSLIVEINSSSASWLEVHYMLKDGANPNVGDPQVRSLDRLSVVRASPVAVVSRLLRYVPPGRISTPPPCTTPQDACTLRSCSCSRRWVGGTLDGSAS